MNSTAATRPGVALPTTLAGAVLIAFGVWASLSLQSWLLAASSARPALRSGASR